MYEFFLSRLGVTTVVTMIVVVICLSVFIFKERRWDVITVTCAWAFALFYILFLIPSLVYDLIVKLNEIIPTQARPRMNEILTLLMIKVLWIVHIQSTFPLFISIFLGFLAIGLSFIFTHLSVLWAELKFTFSWRGLALGAFLLALLITMIIGCLVVSYL